MARVRVSQTTGAAGNLAALAQEFMAVLLQLMRAEVQLAVQDVIRGLPRRTGRLSRGFSTRTFAGEAGRGIRVFNRAQHAWPYRDKLSRERLRTMINRAIKARLRRRLPSLVLQARRIVTPGL